jgi:hydrogenase expression/formation protein HypE
LHQPILELIDAGVELHCARDLTRGGLASALNELATASNLSVELDGDKLAVAPEVAAFCEVLGLDPLHVANEGRMVLFVPNNQANRAIRVLRYSGVTEKSAVAGRVLDDRRALVSVKSASGASRILPMLSGEQLPRIC